MPIAAVPQGVELRKISAVQKRALDDLLRNQRENNRVETTISAAVPALAFIGVGGAAILVAYSYLKDIEIPTAKEIAKVVTTAAGEVVSDVVVDVGGAVAKAAGFENDPKTPEYISIAGTMKGPLSRCKRWELDAQNWYEKTYLSGKLSKSETVQAALAAKIIIKAMKAEGCDKPSSFSQEQWNEA